MYETLFGRIISLSEGKQNMQGFATAMKVVNNSKRIEEYSIFLTFMCTERSISDHYNTPRLLVQGFIKHTVYCGQGLNPTMKYALSYRAHISKLLKKLEILQFLH